MSIYSTASGMILEQRRQELIAKNLTGSPVPGYKKEFLVSKKFDADLSKERMRNSNKFQGTGGGEKITDYTQGSFRTTDDPLDFAIHAEGFFELETQDGKTLYTRNGSFNLSPDGYLITTDGNRVVGEGGFIQLDPEHNIDDLRVSADGELTIDEGNGVERTTIGKFRIVDIEDKSLLEKVSTSNFRLDPKNEGQMNDVDMTDSRFTLMSGYLENSNASPIQDMVTMVQSMREFEMGQKMLKMLDETGKMARQKLQ